MVKMAKKLPNLKALRLLPGGFPPSYIYFYKNEIGDGRAIVWAGWELGLMNILSDLPNSKPAPAPTRPRL